MNKTITYKKVQKFIDEDIMTRIDTTNPKINDPFTTEYSLKVENQYVRFVYAGLGNMIKSVKRVSMNKCLGYLLWLKTSAKRFMRANPQYDYDKYSNKDDRVIDRRIRQTLEMFQAWFVEEFKYEVGIE